MKDVSRRGVLKTLGALPVLMAIGCVPGSSAGTAALTASAEKDQRKNRKATDISNSKQFAPGYLSIVQGPTSDTESLINIFTPRLKKYSYEVVDSQGKACAVDKYQRVEGPGFYHIEKLKISDLQLKEKYTLRVMDGKTLVDERKFSALNIWKQTPNWGLLSCMSDDYRFSAVIEPMWNRLQAEKPDFLILNGDTVYVDSFEFVERQKATEADLWQRYVDTFRRLPLYHWLELVPVFATWDDHDFGTNDSDREFVSKDAALKLFHAVFGGQDLPDVWENGPSGVSSVLHAFGQSFYLMDDRTFRQPNKNQTPQEEFGHWGQEQHQWILAQMKANQNPAWVVNGNQCFNGKDLSYKETFESNHPKEFVNFIGELKGVQSPVVFASGDIHLSEIMRIPKERIGYETYELTSSSMHSYAGEGWDNPMRLPGAFTPEFNFMMIESTSIVGSKALKIDVRCMGLDPQSYFENSLHVQV